MGIEELYNICQQMMGTINELKNKVYMLEEKVEETRIQTNIIKDEIKI